MNQNAELFGRDNIKLFKELWNCCSEEERIKISEIIGQENTKALNPQAVEILEYLNVKAKKGFKPGDANLKFILARLAEGHTADDLKAVVDRKVAQWSEDPKMAQYIRPATLFNDEKFNQYVGELGTPLPEIDKPKPPWSKIPYDNNDLWPWAKKHGYSNPGTLTYHQYRSHLKSEVTKRMDK